MSLKVFSVLHISAHASIWSDIYSYFVLKVLCMRDREGEREFYLKYLLASLNLSAKTLQTTDCIWA